MAHVEEKSPAKIHRELRDVISTLTHHLTDLGNGGGGGGDQDLGIFTLAGSNKGAVMKGDLDEGTNVERKRGAREEPKLTASTYNNYQSVNNSIMVDGRVEAEDPGVHIEIVDCVEDDDGEKSSNDDDDDDEHEKGRKKNKEKKESSHEEKVKREKKEKESSCEEEEKEKKEKESSHVEKGKDEKRSGWED